MFVTLIFSSSEELGFDPTVRQYDPDTHGESEYFVYQVHNKSASQTRYFKTLSCLAEYHPDCITGRGTRVWSVSEVNSFEDRTDKDASQAVLKDVWLNHTALTEGEIQTAIFNDVEGVCRELQMSHDLREAALKGLGFTTQENILRLLKSGDYKKHFLTIICDGVGVTSKTIPPNSIKLQDIFAERDARLYSASIKSPDASRSQHFPSRSRDHPRLGSVCETRAFLPKRQYRVVFQETCLPVHGVQNFKTCMQAIKDAVYGMCFWTAGKWRILIALA